MGMVENLESLLAQGQDTAMVRFGLGNAYLDQGEPSQAVAHLAVAVTHDPRYSAAWKLYGRALAEAGDSEQAIQALDRGIDVAQDNGDVQAAKEMQVARRRLSKAERS